MGIQFPEQYGGAGMSAIDYCICIEELARVDPAVALSVAAHNGLCSAHICLFGTEAQKQRYLVPLARGEKIGAWGLTESDVRQRRRRHAHHGRRAPATCWVLNGSKTFMTHGRVGDVMVVMAVTDRAAGTQGHLGVHRRAAARPACRAGQEGRQARHARQRHQRGAVRQLPHSGAISCSARKGRASSTRCRCSTPAASASPRWRSGSRRAPTRRRSATRSERKAFGKTIGAFQAIQWKLADNGDANRSGAPADLSRGVSEGSRRSGPRSSRRWPSCTPARSP